MIDRVEISLDGLLRLAAAVCQRLGLKETQETVHLAGVG
jgi:Arc/MetJ family transcription regulator